MAQLADTLTTRDAVRRATLDDIIARCEIAATPIEGGPLDGVKVVSMGTLRNQVVETLQVKLPPTSDKIAEVSTPATITVSAICPDCKLPTELVVKLLPVLTVTNDGAELAVKAKTKARVHVCGQESLPLDDDGQTDFGLDDIAGPVPAVEAIADALDHVPHELLADVEIRVPDTIDGWSDFEKRLVYEWAVAVHLNEADGETEIPPLPSVLGGEDPDEPEGGLPVEPAPDDPDGDAPAEVITGDGGVEGSIVDAKADAAVEQAQAEMAEVPLECHGSVHVPGCEHMGGTVPKRASRRSPGDA